MWSPVACLYLDREARELHERLETMRFETCRVAASPPTFAAWHGRRPEGTNAVGAEHPQTQAGPAAEHQQRSDPGCGSSRWRWRGGVGSVRPGRLRGYPHARSPSELG